MIIDVKVKPNSGRQDIKKLSEKEYLVYLKKPASEGKANAELLKLLTRYFKKHIRIKSGVASKRKIIEVIE